MRSKTRAIPNPLEYIALTRGNIAALSAFAEFSAKLENIFSARSK
jgi:hypothetical protein